MAKPDSYLRANGRAACPQRDPDLIYRTSDGYICWRWRPEKTEILEHRWIMDAPAEMDVHHMNEIRHDNRPENLELLTHSDHQKHHTAGTIDDDRMVELYATGLNQTQVGAVMGIHPSVVSRHLRARGVTIRPAGGWPRRARRV